MGCRNPDFRIVLQDILTERYIGYMKREQLLQGRGRGGSPAIKPVSGQCEERSGWPGAPDREKREDVCRK